MRKEIIDLKSNIRNILELLDSQVDDLNKNNVEYVWRCSQCDHQVKTLMARPDTYIRYSPSYYPTPTVANQPSYLLSGVVDAGYKDESKKASGKRGDAVTATMTGRRINCNCGST